MARASGSRTGEVEEGLVPRRSSTRPAAGVAGQGDPFLQATSFPSNGTRSKKSLPPMKMPTNIASRCLLLTLAIGSAAISSTLFAGTSSPGVPSSAVLLGLKAPPPPISAETYAAHGLPWFELYEERRSDLPSAPALRDAKTVAERETELGRRPGEPRIDSRKLPIVTISNRAPDGLRDSE